MSGIIRSWICQNRNCEAWFDSYEPNPACPKCKCVRTTWRPAGGHIGNGAKGADAELRALADLFKLPDLNSAQEGRGAKKVNLPAAPSATPANVHNFGGGFMAAIDPSQGAQCVPTANKVDFKVKAAPGTALARNTAYPEMRTNTAIEARHKP